MDKVTTICYNQKKEWRTRREAVNFFLEGMLECEGAEGDRYKNVLLDLLDGRAVCTDWD